VHEEGRLQESQPFGRFEQFSAAADLAHPYGQPVVGWPSDLESFSATDAENFYRNYYVPANMVVTLVGDCQGRRGPAKCGKYFGQLPAGPRPEQLRNGGTAAEHGADCHSATLRKTPRRTALLSRWPNHLSTRFIQLELVRTRKSWRVRY